MTCGAAMIAVACTGDDPDLAAAGDSGAPETAAPSEGGPGDDGAAPGDGAAPSDADAGLGPCRGRPFTSIGPVQVPTDFHFGPRFYESDAGRRMMYVTLTVTVTGPRNISEATRAGGATEAYESSGLVTELNTGGTQWSPSPSSDGRVLVLARGPAPGSRALYVTTRQDTGNFSPPIPIAAVPNDGGIEDGDPFLLGNGNAVYWGTNRSGANGLSIRRMERNGTSFAPATTVLAGSSTITYTLPVVDDAESTILYATGSTDSSTWDIVEARLDGAFLAGAPIAHPELNQAGVGDAPSWLSPDGCTLYFQRGFAAAPNAMVFVARR